MEDEFSQIDEKITRLKKKKERLQNQKALFLFKEAQTILGDKFSYELVLSVLSHSWKSSPDKQKEEWCKSAHKFRRVSRKQKSKEISNPHSETTRGEDSQATTENP